MFFHSGLFTGRISTAVRVLGQNDVDSCQPRHHYLVAGIAAAVGLLTVYSMTKIWGEVFWKPAPRADTGDEVSLAAGPSGWMMTPIAGLVILTVIIGFGAEVFIEIALKAAEELLHPEMYIKAVFGA